VNTTAVEGLSSLNVCIGRVIFFTPNPGGKWWQILRRVRYILCVERLEQMRNKYIVKCWHYVPSGKGRREVDGRTRSFPTLEKALDFATRTRSHYADIYDEYTPTGSKLVGLKSPDGIRNF
jgi:hypothetical protein